MSGIVERLREALRLNALRGAEYGMEIWMLEVDVTEAADTITDLLAVLELILSDEDVALSRPDYVLAQHTVAKAKGGAS